MSSATDIGRRLAGPAERLADPRLALGIDRALKRSTCGSITQDV